MICPQCFNLLDDDADICPFCQTVINNTDFKIENNVTENYADELLEDSQRVEDNTITFDNSISQSSENTSFPNRDTSNNYNASFSSKPHLYITTQDKAFAALSYLGFVPLIISAIIGRKTNFIKLHLCQGLIIFICSIILKILTQNDDVALLPLLFLYIILGAFKIAGIVRAIKGTDTPLPVIGVLAKKLCK